MKKPKRRVPDWEAIERVYRLGQLSNQEIGDKYGLTRQAIFKRAQRHGWQRDLSCKVRLMVNAKLSSLAANVNEAVDADSRARAYGDETAAEGVADVVVDVLLAHREAISKVRNLADKVLSLLRDQLTTNADFDHKSAGRTIAAISTALSRLIPLERQAFNIKPEQEQEQAQDCDLPESIRERLAIYDRKTVRNGQGA